MQTATANPSQIDATILQTENAAPAPRADGNRTPLAKLEYRPRAGGLRAAWWGGVYLCSVEMWTALLSMKHAYAINTPQLLVVAMFVMIPIGFTKMLPSARDAINGDARAFVIGLAGLAVATWAVIVVGVWPVAIWAEVIEKTNVAMGYDAFANAGNPLEWYLAVAPVWAVSWLAIFGIGVGVVVILPWIASERWFYFNIENWNQELIFQAKLRERQTETVGPPPLVLDNIME